MAPKTAFINRHTAMRQYMAVNLDNRLVPYILAIDHATYMHIEANKAGSDILVLAVLGDTITNQIAALVQLRLYP